MDPALQRVAANIFTQPSMSNFEKWVELYRGLSGNLADMHFRISRNRPTPIETVHRNHVVAAGVDLDSIQLRCIPRAEREHRMPLGLCLYCSG